MSTGFGSGSLTRSSRLRETIKQKQILLAGYSSKAIAEAKSAGTTFTCGLAVFVLSNIILALSRGSKETKYFHRWEGYLIWAIGQACGLFMMIRDLDVNSYFASNQFRLAVILVLWALVYIIVLFTAENAFKAPLGAKKSPFGLQIVVFFPFLYLAARYRQIVQRQERYPSLTELFTLIFALDLIGRAGRYITETQYGVGYQAAMIGTRLVGSFFVLLAYRWSQHNGESATLNFNTAIVAYLTSIGVAYLIAGVIIFVVDKAAGYGTKHPYAATAKFGVAFLHLIPPLVLLTCPTRVQRMLGRRWLSQRKAQRQLNRSSGEMLQELERGNLVEVERACMQVHYTLYLIPSSHTLLSYPPLIPSSHTLLSHPPLTSSSHTLLHAGHIGGRGSERVRANE
jgi:hypothetical protein